MNAEESARLARIETKLDVFRKGQADHETRIRFLERWTGKAAGAIGVLSLAAGVLGTKLFGG